MCGIHGLYAFDGSAPSRATLSVMGDLTRHRGPDDFGAHIDGPCGIAMRRLSIIDLAGGHQPLTNEDGTLWLVANGEIYNYRELSRELAAQGHRLRTNSDCETLLHLYEQHGDAFLARVNGMFAFALWDARRRRLLIGRDRLGIKPLYVWNDGRRLVFASEAKAILGVPGIPTELDRDALAAYLTLGYVPAPQSIFRGIRKLPPATLLVVENGQARERRYWQLPSQVDDSVDDATWIARIRHRLEESVRLQMVSDVPIGAFLSGGIDSSAVVAFMSMHSDRPVKTYAIGFDGGDAESFYNELPYARQIAERFGTDHHEILVRPDIVSLLPRLLWHLDEPIADSAFVTTYLVSEFARRDVTVILSGVGGDELFAGYRRYLGNHYRRRFEQLPAGMRRVMTALGARLPSDRHSPMLNTMRLAKGFLASAALPLDERYRSYVEVFDDEAAAGMLRAPMAANWHALAVAFADAKSGDDLNRMLAVDVATQLPDDLLMLTDKMSMAVSLECRVPLLDHELCELAAAIPERVKLRGGRLKHVLKEALADVLPRGILERKKRGFGTPMGAWFKGALAPLVRQMLSPEAIERRGLFDPRAVSALIAAHDASRIDGTDRLLALLNFEIWARLYLEGRAPEDVVDEIKVAAA
jgi:asparagine synthase (glutamine-hydrolysing)